MKYYFVRIVSLLLSFASTAFLSISGLYLREKVSQCCNGTLGYADTPMMPCAALECCDKSSVVAVIPVNHALGYGFRCVAKSRMLAPGKSCHRDGHIVASTNQTSILYREKVCCPGFKFDVKYNTENTGIVIRCKLRSRNQN